MGKAVDYKKSVTRQITFPSRLMDIAESKAKIFGYSFPEYVRYVLTKDIEDGIKEYREGRAKSFKSRKEFLDYFSAIIDEEE